MSFYTPDDFFKNFPLPTMRQKQRHVLKEISDAFNSGYKNILLEAPTGFGKSAAAVAVTRTLGTSYTCTSTKDLQAQYHRDFPFIKIVKGKSNFPCIVNQDYLNAEKYECKTCSKFSSNVGDCGHTTVEHGPCITDTTFKGNRCKYRTFSKHYEVLSKGTVNETVEITKEALANYKSSFGNWTYLKNFNLQERAAVIKWRPCEYFHQLIIGLRSSHTILNYSAFLSLKAAQRLVEPRECLVLDECHSMEQEIVKYKGISMSRRRWRRYIPNFALPDYNYNLEQWSAFLQEIERKMYELTGQKAVLFQIKTLRRLRAEMKADQAVPVKEHDGGEQKEEKDVDDPYGLVEKYYNPKRKDEKKNKPTVVTKQTVSELEQKIQESANFLSDDVSIRLPEEILVDALNDRDRLTRGINSLLLDNKNWIVTDVKRDGNEVTGVELKPLDVAPYSKDLFSFCPKTLMMSATVLNHNAFCKSLGLEPDKVKFIRVESDFPVANRPIYPLNVAWLNSKTIALDTTQKILATMIDKIMTLHKDQKGIIHTTSYHQLKFIRANLSKENDSRLIETNPELQRVDVVQEHFTSNRPTVLISPSLYLGLDLKDGFSRFQVITKVPFPDMNDRWIGAKMTASEEWYRWQTAMRLVQAYGRSVRSIDDWAKTYVLDSMFNTFVNKNRSMIPQWFLDAINGNYHVPLAV